MENNKKQYPAKDLFLKNPSYSTEYPSNRFYNKESNKEEVHFHSDLINKNVGDLDITV